MNAIELQAKLRKARQLMEQQAAIDDDQRKDIIDLRAQRHRLRADKERLEAEIQRLTSQVNALKNTLGSK